MAGKKVGWREGAALALLLSVCISLGGAGVARAANDRPSEDEVQGDRFSRAKRAAERSQFHAARELLVKFLNASVGDRRKGEAETILRNAFTGEAAQLTQSGLAIEASTVWLDYAQWLKEGADAAAARKSAVDVLHTGFDAASKARDFDLALAIAAAYDKQFADASPLCTAEQANELRVDRLVAGAQKHLAAATMAADLADAIEHGIAESALSAKGVNAGMIRQAYAQVLLDEGQLTRAIELLGTWATTAEAPAERTKYETMLSKALLDRADAYVAFGNVDMAEKALAAATANAATASSGALRITSLKRRLDAIKAGVGHDGHALKFAEPLTGPGSWQSDGGSYTLDGKVDFNKAIIAVGPGFVLEGGSIFVGGGSRLELHGTAARPIVFRKVKLSADLNGVIKGEFVVFEDCQFAKGGPWFAYFNSKWIFSNCLLLRSNWRGLSGMDYGLQVSGCMLCDCKFPPRLIGDDKVEDKARKYRDQWNKVDNNLFVHCEMAPSFAWCTNQCVFSGCDVNGWDSYRSVNDLRVMMSVPSPGDRFCELLQHRTQNEEMGAVRFVKASGAPVSTVSKRFAPLFRLADAAPAQ